MKNIMRKTLSAVTAAVILLIFASACGEQQSGAPAAAADPGQTDEAVTEAAETEPQYSSPELDLGGGAYRILASSTTWGFNTTIDFEEQSGEMLDDAQFIRNRKLEEQFNMKMEVVRRLMEPAAATGERKTQILADEIVVPAKKSTAAKYRLKNKTFHFLKK